MSNTKQYKKWQCELGPLVPPRQKSIFQLNENESIAWHSNRAKVFCDNVTADVTTRNSDLIAGFPHAKRVMVNSFLTSIVFIMSIYEKKKDLSRMSNRVETLEKANALDAPFNVKSLLVTVITYLKGTSTSLSTSTRQESGTIGSGNHVQIAHHKNQFSDNEYHPEYHRS